jgi:ABC-type multidrug transport system ATPase subunit
MTGCLAIVGFVAFYIIAAWLSLRFLPLQISFSKQVKSSEREIGAVDAVNRAKSAERGSAEVTVRLQDVKLRIDKKGFKRSTLQILQGITMDFEPGKLNIIMGPSGTIIWDFDTGSGKSSLLNLLCRRLHGSLTTRYQYSGEMLFNNTIPSDDVIRSLTSYVVQDDNALLPSLTVRETLHFAAIIRLPRHLSKSQKLARAEDVLAKLGLRHCAETLIGSEFVKGISGGEKRRVSIAVQILTDPKILMLDEPSSGLDAHTAHSMMELLQALATEGRTVICTIHQSRSDLFPLFGRLLLLANGGRMIYSGRGEDMMEYFEDAGYKCPTFVNPAYVPLRCWYSDFALDLCSVDLQQADREIESRKRVEELILHCEKTRDVSESVEKVVSSLPAQLGSLRRRISPFMTVYPVLLKRSYLNFKRSPNIVLTRIMQVASFGIILVLFYARLGNDYVSVQNRVGYIQEINALVFIGMLVHLRWIANIE